MQFEKEGKGERQRIAICYTYPQLPIQKEATGPGSIFNQQGGSVFNRRQHAAICLAFAARHPGRVRSVVVSSPTSCEPLPQAFRDGLAARERAIREAGMRAVAETSLRGSYPETLRQVAPERFERFRSRWLGNDPDSFIALNRLLPTDIGPELCRVACPALVIGCAHDPIRSPADTLRVAKAISRSRFVEADSGHFLHLQSPEKWAALVVPYFNAALEA